MRLLRSSLRAHATVVDPIGSLPPALREDPRNHSAAPDLLDGLVADQEASGWIGGVYEPEIDAFGGPEGMDVAHDVFCTDSRAALAETGNPGARERCVLLLSTMFRSAGLDPFEAGDVWAKLGSLRPPVTPPTGPARDRAVAAMLLLMNADAGLRPDAEPGWVERVAAFEDAGHQLRQLAADGRLTRGLRAVLAHHAIFAFNRAGVPSGEQAATAWLGRQVTFAQGEAADVSTRRSTSQDPNLTRMETTLTPVTEAAELREALVTHLIDRGHLRTPGVIAAFRGAERHQFLPRVDLQTAYAEDAVPTKHNATGEMISCISAPSIVATQLEQMGTKPGHKILEAGAATGYNAHLLGQLVAPGGHVWTVDVDQDLVDGAQKNLAQAEAPNVSVVLGDGAAGLPGHAPFRPHPVHRRRWRRSGGFSTSSPPVDAWSSRCGFAAASRDRSPSSGTVILGRPSRARWRRSFPCVRASVMTSTPSCP